MHHLSFKDNNAHVAGAISCISTELKYIETLWTFSFSAKVHVSHAASQAEFLAELNWWFSRNAAKLENQGAKNEQQVIIIALILINFQLKDDAFKKVKSILRKAERRVCFIVYLYWGLNVVLAGAITKLKQMASATPPGLVLYVTLSLSLYHRRFWLC